jgi:3-hydroxyisobutyrate dehydrogenase-like beta-hydroxyacid dehydrogenase
MEKQPTWPTVGFIGLGTMGLPMAAHLARAGVPLVVHDQRPEAVAGLVSGLTDQAGPGTPDGAGARAAEIQGVQTPRQVAEGCSVLFTCLPDDAILETVLLGEEGVVQGAKPGLVTCDCSTVTPQATRRVGAALGAAGVTHLAAPMLGSKPQALAGEIFFILGGEAEAARAVAPLLALMGRAHRHVGEAGTASTIKLLHNALGDVTYVAVAESLALCIKAGVDPRTYYEVVRNGGGMAYGSFFERKVPTILAGDYSPRFKLALAHKDITLARGLAREAGVAMPLMELAGEAFDEALAAGHGEEDASAVSRTIERRTGVKLSRP